MTDGPDSTTDATDLAADATAETTARSVNRTPFLLGLPKKFEGYRRSRSESA